jgi:hypothetical protein
MRGAVAHYFGARVPALAVGFAAGTIGLQRATYLFVVAIIALSATGLVWLRARELRAAVPTT